MRRSILFFAAASALQAAPFNYSPPKDYPVQEPRDFALYAEALALQAKEDGLEAAILDSGANPLPITNGRILGFSSGRSDYEWNPGLRVGFQFFFHGEDRWQADLAWTWLQITNSKRFSTDTGTLIPLWLIPVGVPTATNQSAHSTWEARYNVLDARFGKWFKASQSFLAQPHIGARIAVIDQHFAVNYGGLFGTVKGAIPHMDNDCMGFGLRAGVDTEWRLGKYWLLFANGAASLLWTHFEIAESLAQGEIEGYDFVQNFNANTPNFDLALGLGWERSLANEQFILSMKLAYEFHEWWDMNQLRRFYSGEIGYANDLVSRGNFTLNGLSFRLQIDL